jgi:hypothetical protein
LQRKPVNRLGLRGATEVKEHPWLKYYPWKEIYDKTLDSPFIPKTGDNFDAKYCNAPEKMGPDTKEKYDSYLRDEGYKEAFKEFTYFNNGVTSTFLEDKMSFNNPHNNISNYIMPAEQTTIILNNNLPTSLLQNSSSVSNMSIETKRFLEIKTSASLNIEHKFLKIKKQSNSSSTSSLLRQYRQSSQNSTSTSVNYLKRTGGTSTQNNY